MYDETKLIVKKAFKVGKILFSLSGPQYKKLLNATSAVSNINKEDVQEFLDEGLSLDQALITALRERFKAAAVEAGFSEEHGIAVLEYAAILKGLKEDE